MQVKSGIYFEKSRCMFFFAGQKWGLFSKVDMFFFAGRVTLWQLCDLSDRKETQMNAKTDLKMSTCQD